MEDHDNIDAVCDVLDQIIDGFGFDLTTGDEDLGQDCAGIFAEGILELAEQGLGSEGKWDANEPIYAKYKERVYKVTNKPNVRTGQMLSLQSLRHARVGHELVDLSYGWGVAPTRTATGVPIKNADKAVTDRDKARFAHTGQGPHGTRRPFYALNEEIDTHIQERCQERLNGYVDEVWNS